MASSIAQCCRISLALGLEMLGTAWSKVAAMAMQKHQDQVNWFLEQTKLDISPCRVFYSFHIMVSFSKAMYSLVYIYGLSPWSIRDILYTTEKKKLHSDTGNLKL